MRFPVGLRQVLASAAKRGSCVGDLELELARPDRVLCGVGGGVALEFRVFGVEGGETLLGACDGLFGCDQAGASLLVEAFEIALCVIEAVLEASPGLSCGLLFVGRGVEGDLEALLRGRILLAHLLKLALELAYAFGRCIALGLQVFGCLFGIALAGALPFDDLVVVGLDIAAVLEFCLAGGDGVLKSLEFVAGLGMCAARAAHGLHARNTLGEQAAGTGCFDGFRVFGLGGSGGPELTALDILGRLGKRFGCGDTYRLVLQFVLVAHGAPPRGRPIRPPYDRASAAAVARWSRCTFHGRITRKQTKADRGTDMAQREIEIDEALAAVEDALDCLDAAARDLKSARNWGLLDMFGGGFWISAFKQGRMQTAQEHLNAAQRALSRLADELNDVQGFSGIGPDVGDFLLAADWLFDNVFAQEHLNAAQRALSRLADELNDVQGFSGIGPDVGDFLLAADWLFDNVLMDAMVQQRIAESRERVAQAIAQCEDVRDQLLALRRPNRGAGNGLPGAE